MKYTHVPELNRLCTAMHCYRLRDVTCPSVPVRGRCVMREEQERERRDDTNGLQAVSLYLPHDTILRPFPLSRYCHFAGVLT